MLRNLIDEEAGLPNHPELWLQFAEALGVSKEEVQFSGERAETSNLIGTFRSICAQGTTAEGLAALYAYESQIPAVCESKIKGLVENYNMTEPDDYEYFTVHVEADRAHAAAEREMLSQHINDDNATASSKAVDRVLDALWQMLSGVCRQHAIAC